ncbi:MAG: MBL fold metallo-hydrolase [Candidatus Nanopelagicales bacterium]|nr:MBL fold metallo-hydrolase [Candidatus Nanopelagicales bacterium]
MKPLGSTGPWAAGPVTTRASAVLAPNPGWMTLDGTNTWLLVEPGAPRAVVVDPGPDDPGHRAAVLAAAQARGTRIAAILLTHGHADHAEGARALHEATGAPVRALDPAHRLGGEGLAEGDVVTVDGLEVSVVATPGHTRDSLTFLLPADRALLTGDTVLGRGSAVIVHPDGDLGAYLASLARLAELAGATEAAWVLPGHGPASPDPAGLIADYRAHRAERLALVAAALASGISDREALLDAAYPDVPDALRWAAHLSLAAQLAHLTGRAGAPPAG